MRDFTLFVVLDLIRRMFGINTIYGKNSVAVKFYAILQCLLSLQRVFTRNFMQVSRSNFGFDFSLDPLNRDKFYTPLEVSIW